MDIQKIFKSKVRKEIFRIYYTNPDKEYYLRELERTLGIPVSMIQRELRNLEKAGVFAHRKQGNLVYYYLNKNYPLFDELKSIISKTIGVRGLIKGVLKRFGDIKVAFLYGSFAKGEEKTESDIDLFVVGRVDERRLVMEINRLEKILKREINYTIYSPVELHKKMQKSEGFIIDVMENPKIFLIGEENELR
jgi:predicted nucleotidyltransferase